MEYLEKSVRTFVAEIHIAGDIDTIRAECRRYVNKGACVRVSESEYIFTGGAERGAIIGFINYPRFPKDENDIVAEAISLAKILIEACFQFSASVVTTNETIFISDDRKR